MGIAVSVENGLQRQAGYWTIIPPTMGKPSRASRLGLSHWAGPSVTRSAGWSQRWYGGIIVDILAKESKFP